MPCKEVVNEWVSTPRVASRKVTRPARAPQPPGPPPMFAIMELRGASTRKRIRLVGDFKLSRANSLLGPRGAFALNASGTMCAMARALATSRPHVALLLTIVDLAHSDKNIRVSPTSPRFAVVAISGHQGEVSIDYLGAQQFAPRRAQRFGRELPNSRLTL